MMTQMVSALRWRAVAKLQDKRAKFPEGSLEFDACDRAIDYILDGDRPDGPFLARNAYRNARWSILRERRLPMGSPVPLYTTKNDGREVLAFEEGPRRDETYTAQLAPSPQIQLELHEEVEVLREAASSINRRAPAVLDCWQDGRNVAATAEILCISTHYVKKIRRQIRDSADTLRAAA
jgi:hypothetical protein